MLIQTEVPSPLHVVEVDGVIYHIRRNWYGHYQVNQATRTGLERSIGRMQGYVSVKECWDALFERSIQPDTMPDPLLELARVVARQDDALGMQARAAVCDSGIPT